MTPKSKIEIDDTIPDGLFRARTEYSEVDVHLNIIGLRPGNDRADRVFKVNSDNYEKIIWYLTVGSG